jgi:hypothetical protein
VGRIHLILEAYKRLETLPPDLRSDVRTAVGWTITKDELSKLPITHDQWFVLGQRVDCEEKFRVQRTWLWGASTQRPALLLQFAAQAQGFEASFVAGTRFQGDLVFYPSASPLRASLISRTDEIERFDKIPEASPPTLAIEEYANAVAKVPWCELWPLRLENVVPQPVSADSNPTWLARGRDGYVIPINPRFGAGWELLAVSGGQPLDLFGEWDGEFLRPLSLASAGRFHSILQRPRVLAW